MAASRIVALLAVVPLLPLVFILLVQLSLRFWGWYLQVHTSDKKAALVNSVKQERSETSEIQPTSQEEAEDEWEKVEKAGTADNGKPVQDDWSGVVGFFHPFW